jgi:hypothetical protein
MTNTIFEQFTIIFTYGDFECGEKTVQGLNADHALAVFYHNNDGATNAFVDGHAVDVRPGGPVQQYLAEMR